MSGASSFFKTACEITFFTEEDYVRNYIRAQNLIDFQTVIDTPVIPNLTASGIARFALYGLSIFPRSCALHTLRATLYMRENNYLCANQLHQSALRLTHLQRTTFNTTEYLSILSAYLTADSIVDTDNTNPANIAAHMNSTCIPHLYHHSTQDYQQLYNTITTTIGTAWTNLSTHHLIPKKRSDMQPIVQFSVNAAHSDYTNDSESSKVRLPSLQVGCSVPIRCARPGFLIADAQETISTHYVTLSHNLSMIESESIGMLYSSHTLEHLSHQLPLATCVSYPKSDRNGDKSCYSELDATLVEWYRVLAYDGLLLLSVPDMAVLTERFQMYKNSTQNMDVMRRILFGGQNDEYDFHKNGFYFQYLKELLLSHKFCGIEKVYQLGLFMDASGTTFTGKDMISLSVRAKK
eukprot:gene18242-20773_t